MERSDVEAFDRVASQLGIYGDRLLALEPGIKAQASDIRYQAGQPVAVCGREGVYYLQEKRGAAREYGPGLLTVTPAQVQELFLQICGHSVFSHEHEIAQGYVQMEGLCRAGVCGTAVLEDGRVKGLRDIRSLVFRIPRDVPGCGDRLFRLGVDPVRGLLIAGEPSSGKSTLLRDIARSLSTGKFGPSRRVAVLDCRGELGGYDLGPCADVLRGYPKAQGLDMAIRSLSPEVVFCDELAPGDLPAVEAALHAGVGLVATVHATRDSVYRRPLCKALLDTGAFGTLVTLKGRATPSVIDMVEPVEVRLESRAG